MQKKAIFLNYQYGGRNIFKLIFRKAMFDFTGMHVLILTCRLDGGEKNVRLLVWN